jgi:hypothetical protein
MLVQARQVDYSECPPEIRPFATPGQVFLEMGKRYRVFGIRTEPPIMEKNGATPPGKVVLFLVVDDIGYPSWKPAWLFDIVDPRLADDWIYNQIGGEPIFAPPIVAETEESLVDLMDHVPEQLDRFFQYAEGPRLPDEPEL